MESANARRDALLLLGLIIASVLTLGIWSAAAAPSRGTLHRVGRPAMDWSDLGGSSNHTGFAALWSDGSSYQEQFWIRYHGCRQIGQGTLRIRLYDQEPLLGRQPYFKLNTVTEWGTSGSVLLAYPTENGINTYWARIQVLSPHRCAWTWGQLGH